jgi:hypothetical protein
VINPIQSNPCIEPYHRHRCTFVIHTPAPTLIPRPPSLEPKGTFDFPFRIEICSAEAAPVTYDNNSNNVLGWCDGCCIAACNVVELHPLMPNLELIFECYHKVRSHCCLLHLACTVLIIKVRTVDQRNLLVHQGIVACVLGIQRKLSLVHANRECACCRLCHQTMLHIVGHLVIHSSVDRLVQRRERPTRQGIACQFAQQSTLRCALRRGGLQVVIEQALHVVDVDDPKICIGQVINICTFGRCHCNQDLVDLYTSNVDTLSIKCPRHYRCASESYWRQRMHTLGLTSDRCSSICSASTV